MIELISLCKKCVLSIFSKFLILGIFGSEEEILQKITPWRKNQLLDFCAIVLFSNIYGIKILFSIKLQKVTQIELIFFMFLSVNY